jgi:transposase
MIRTYKIKHNLDLTTELNAAEIVVHSVVLMRKQQIAQKQKLKSPTSKDFKCMLKSTIIASLIKKYFNNKKLKDVKRQPKLVFNHNNQKQIYIKNNILHLTPIGLKIDISNEWWYTPLIKPLNVEVDNTYIYLACEIPDPTQILPNSFIGIDLNATADLAVICDANTGQVFKKGKQIRHIKQKYQHLRSARQRSGKTKYATKDHNRTLDSCRKLAVEIVDVALRANAGIRLEQLKGLSKK